LAERRCAVCNAIFRASPSDKTVTCSKACSSAHRSRKHIGKRNIWSDTSLARDAAARTGNLTIGTPAAKRSPIAGPFETNINAKHWTVIAPDGAEHHVRNLRLWCERHADLFAPSMAQCLCRHASGRSMARRQAATSGQPVVRMDAQRRALNETLIFWHSLDRTVPLRLVS